MIALQAVSSLATSMALNFKSKPVSTQTGLPIQRTKLLPRILTLVFSSYHLLPQISRLNLSAPLRSPSTPSHAPRFCLYVSPVLFCRPFGSSSGMILGNKLPNSVKSYQKPCVDTLESKRDIRSPIFSYINLVAEF